MYSWNMRRCLRVMANTSSFSALMRAVRRTHNVGKYVLQCRAYWQYPSALIQAAEFEAVHLPDFCHVLMEHAALFARHGEYQFLFRFDAGRFGGLVFLVCL